MPPHLFQRFKRPAPLELRDNIFERLLSAAQWVLVSILILQKPATLAKISTFWLIRLVRMMDGTGRFHLSKMVGAANMVV
jgi:hypothetical protein